VDNSALFQPIFKSVRDITNDEEIDNVINVFHFVLQYFINTQYKA
jgi:hypothetical protein